MPHGIELPDAGIGPVKRISLRLFPPHIRTLSHYLFELLQIVRPRLNGDAVLRLIRSDEFHQTVKYLNPMPLGPSVPFIAMLGRIHRGIMNKLHFFAGSPPT
jgi:hypothetical protein